MAGRNKTDKPKDQHKSGFMVRLPERYRPTFAALYKKHRRPMTVEVQIALEKHAKDEGVTLPPDTSI
jgi:hypothetical protein